MRGCGALQAVAVVLLCAVASLSTDVAQANETAAQMALLERALSADPENLVTAAEYRQLAIAAATFDRPIDFLETLAKRKATGPNVHISLALAYVDKVPTSGDIRRLYLGRDAMSELTKAIERQPSVLAYYLRGQINLYYNNFIFHRVPRGIADLEQALRLADGNTPAPLLCRVYTSLGDGHAKIESADKAREVWSTGLQKFPGDDGLKRRLGASAPVLKDIVTTALYAGTRVDTSLNGVLTTR
jgi:tetratricopeptide (TPR) repeat protein